MSCDSCDSVHQPFIPKEGLEISYHTETRMKSRYSCQLIALTLGNFLFLLFNLLLFGFGLGQSRPSDQCPKPSIDGLDRSLTTTLFRNLTGNLYAGQPSTELDHAWDSLMKPTHMRVTQDELRHDNQESVKLADGGGYLAWLGVYHELHCIRMVQKWTYQDYYHSNLTQTELDHLRSHVDHCIDIIRQASMCRADASLTTFTWHPNKTEPMFNATQSIHTCVDWDRFVDSASDRVVSEDEVSRLQNPLMVASGLPSLS